MREIKVGEEVYVPDDATWGGAPKFQSIARGEVVVVRGWGSGKIVDHVGDLVTSAGWVAADQVWRKRKKLRVGDTVYARTYDTISPVDCVCACEECTKNSPGAEGWLDTGDYVQVQDVFVKPRAKKAKELPAGSWVSPELYVAQYFSDDNKYQASVSGPDAEVVRAAVSAAAEKFPAPKRKIEKPEDLRAGDRVVVLPDAAREDGEYSHAISRLRGTMGTVSEGLLGFVYDPETGNVGVSMGAAFAHIGKSHILIPADVDTLKKGDEIYVPAGAKWASGLPSGSNGGWYVFTGIDRGRNVIYGNASIMCVCSPEYVFVRPPWVSRKTEDKTKFRAGDTAFCHVGKRQGEYHYANVLYPTGHGQFITDTQLPRELRRGMGGVELLDKDWEKVVSAKFKRGDTVLCAAPGGPKRIAVVTDPKPGTLYFEFTDGSHGSCPDKYAELFTVDSLD